MGQQETAELVALYNMCFPAMYCQA